MRKLKSFRVPFPQKFEHAKLASFFVLLYFLFNELYAPLNLIKCFKEYLHNRKGVNRKSFLVLLFKFAQKMRKKVASIILAVFYKCAYVHHIFYSRLKKNTQSISRKREWNNTYFGFANIKFNVQALSCFHKK